MSKTVTVEIDLGGASVITVKGVKGKACADLTKELERALGEVVSVTATPEAQERPLRQDQGGLTQRS